MSERYDPDRLRDIHVSVDGRGFCIRVDDEELRLSHAEWLYVAHWAMLDSRYHDKLASSVHNAWYQSSIGPARDALKAALAKLPDESCLTEDELETGRFVVDVLRLVAEQLSRIPGASVGEPLEVVSRALRGTIDHDDIKRRLTELQQTEQR